MYPKMQCPLCGRVYTNGERFCPDDGTELVPATVEVHPLDPQYEGTNGFWKVLTDDGGGGSRFVGNYVGEIDVIAKALAHHHHLVFERPHISEIPEPDGKNRTKVSVQIGSSGFGSLGKDEQIATMADYLKDRPVSVSGASFYGSVTVKFDKDQNDG